MLSAARFVDVGMGTLGTCCQGNVAKLKDRSLTQTYLVCNFAVANKLFNFGENVNAY